MKKSVLLLLGVISWGFSFATLTTITTGTLSSNIFCGGSTVNVPFTVDAKAKSGNVFTAQLSDASGDFTTPVAIGSLNSQNSGTIIGTLPVSSASGTKYKIRVVSSKPAVTGSSTAKFSISPKPTGLTTSNITSSSVKLAWNAISIATNYSVRYSITGGSWSSAITVNATNYTFTGLQSNTNYTLEVREKCGDNVKSGWASATATTSGAVCATPTGFFVDTISCTYSTFEWNAVAGASSYSFLYRVNGSSTYTKKIVTGTQYHLSGLIPAGDYCAKIAAICGAGDTSAYTTEQCWEQNYTNCRVAFEAAAGLKVFPNPSYGDFKMQYQAHAGDVAQIIIRNAVGQVVYQVSQVSSDGNNEQSISLKQKGLYIVQLKLAQHTLEATVDIE